MAENASDPTRIERDLDQTRSRLGSHLSELQDRISPGQVLGDMMGYFRGSEGAEFGRNAKAVIQDVPRTGDKALRKEVALQGTDITRQPT